MKSPLKISNAARREIDGGLVRLESKAGVGLIPAVMWLDANLNKDIRESGVIIGAYTSAQRIELSDKIISDGGYEFVLLVSDDDLVRFMGKTLDFKGGRFVLL